MSGGSPRYRPATLLAHAGMPTLDASGALLIAPQFSTTFHREADNSYASGRVYGRDDNPTFEAPQRLITQLEGGEDALIFGSGMAAATTMFLSLAPGDHVVAPKVMYWALRKWLQHHATSWGLNVEFVDATDPSAIAGAVLPNRTKLVWIETPANPTWAVTDIAAAAEAAHRVGAVLAVDNTAPTPLLTKPIAHGADFVMHSGTKYLNGHDNAFSGFLVAATVSDQWERVRALRRSLGAIPGTLDAWLLLNGMRTLAVRLERACHSAGNIAEAMVAHNAVERVLFPGLSTHPGHKIAARQMSGYFGALLSIEVRGGEAAAVRAAGRLQLWQRATSFGGPESLVEHRRSVEGNDSPAAPGLLRLSVGLEDSKDLIDDLRRALA